MPSQIVPRRPQPPKSLIDFVQAHERSWGNEQYLNRPNLADILNAPVVAFWKPSTPPNDNPRTKNPEPPRETITLHDDLTDIEKYMTRLLLNIADNPPDKHLVRVFRHGKRVKVKGVRILFDEETPSDDDF